MPVYEYQCECCGAKAERTLPISQCPDLGVALADACPGCGRPWSLKRILSVSVAFNDAELRGEKYPYSAKTLPHYSPGFEHYDSSGFGVVTSRKHEKELQAKGIAWRD